MTAAAVTMLSVSAELATNEPPTEFRIFRAGRNDSKKGVFVFDAESATSVMAEFHAHGIDQCADYEHAMIDPTTRPQDRIAAASFKLEVRAGELWAVNVRWTKRAAAGIREREWRYTSATFLHQGDRIVELINVAITNLPAARGLDALIAASTTHQQRETPMSASQTGKTWEQLSNMEKHRILTDEPAEAARLKSAGKPVAVKLSAAERAVSYSAVSVAEQLGAMGQHRMLNDNPATALAIYTEAAKVEPERFAGLVVVARNALAART